MDDEPGAEVGGTARQEGRDHTDKGTVHTQGEQSRFAATSKGQPAVQWLLGRSTVVRQVWGQARKSSQQDNIGISKVQEQAQAYSQHNPGKDHKHRSELKCSSHNKEQWL